MYEGRHGGGGDGIEGGVSRKRRGCWALGCWSVMKMALRICHPLPLCRWFAVAVSTTTACWHDRF